MNTAKLKQSRMGNTWEILVRRILSLSTVNRLYLYLKKNINSTKTIKKINQPTLKTVQDHFFQFRMLQHILMFFQTKYLIQQDSYQKLALKQYWLAVNLFNITSLLASHNSLKICNLKEKYKKSMINSQ